jgi:hypothetical protein
MVGSTGAMNSDELKNSISQPNSWVNQELLMKLATMLVVTDSVQSLAEDLWDHEISNHLRPEQTPEEVLSALNTLLENYPFLLNEEDQSQALELPEDHLQAERLFDGLMANYSNEDA